MNKKAVFIICACIIGLVCILLIPKNVEEINNAAVNSENGDIALCYFDYSGSSVVMRVVVFDKNGEKLFSKGYFESICAEMLFDGEELCITVGKNNKKYSFDRNGEETDNDISIEEIKEGVAFNGWNYSSGKYTCYFENYEYCYKQATIFSRNAIVTISNGERVVTIYESP